MGPNGINKVAAVQGLSSGHRKASVGDTEFYEFTVAGCSILVDKLGWGAERRRDTVNTDFRHWGQTISQTP